MGEEKRDNWEMPKPIFRQTSGSRPLGFAKRIEVADTRPSGNTHPEEADAMLATLYAPPENHSAPEGIVPPIRPAASIEPQPNISDQFTVGQSMTESAEAVPKRRSLSRILIVIGILAILGLALGFVFLIYFLFFYTPVQTNSF